MLELYSETPLPITCRNLAPYQPAATYVRTYVPYVRTLVLLPEVTYVRTYIRTYVRILPLPPNCTYVHVRKWLLSPRCIVRAPSVTPYPKRCFSLWRSVL